MRNRRIAVVLAVIMLLATACGSTVAESEHPVEREQSVEKENDMNNGAQVEVLEVVAIGEKVEFKSVDGKTIVIEKAALDREITNHVLEIGDYVTVHFNEYSENEDGTFSVDMEKALYFESDVTKYKNY